MVHTPICANQAQKQQFQRFYQFFSELLQHSLLILIESPNIFNWKLGGLSESVKKGKFVTKIFLSDNVESSSKRNNKKQKVWWLYLINYVKPDQSNLLTDPQAFWGQNVGPSWVKNGKKTIFIPATSLPTKFSLKTKFLTATVS